MALGKFEAAWQGVKGGILEVKAGDMARTAAETWLALSGAERAGAALIAQTHAQRDEITAHLRAALKQEGYLGQDSITLQTLKSANLTEADKTQAFSYREGQTVLFRTGDRAQGFDRAERWKVERVDREAGLVSLSNGRDTKAWRPGESRPSSIEVFDKRELDLAERDIVRWTRTDDAQRVHNADRARVEAITERHITFASEQGAPLTLSRKDPALSHLDHGWTSTVHAMQGQTADRVIGVIDAAHPHLTNQKAFYVAVSRARDGVSIITNDQATLKDTLEQQTGEKIDALEVEESREPKLDEPMKEPGQEKSLDRDIARENEVNPMADREIELELEIEEPEISL